MKNQFIYMVAAILFDVLVLQAAADDLPRAVIDLSWAAGQPVLTFDLTSGTAYWVDERTNLLAGVWEGVGEGYAVSGPDRHPLTTSAVSPRFFRLRYEDEFYDAGDGEAWGTFDFTILSNRVEALREAHYNLGDGGNLIITNYLADSQIPNRFLHAQGCPS